MTTKEFAKKCKVAEITVRKWCKNNNIQRQLGRQGVMEYVLTNEDIKTFKNRPKRGRPKTTIIEENR